MELIQVFTTQSGLELALVILGGILLIGSLAIGIVALSEESVKVSLICLTICIIGVIMIYMGVIIPDYIVKTFIVTDPNQYTDMLNDGWKVYAQDGRIVSLFQK